MTLPRREMPLIWVWIRKDAREERNSARSDEIGSENGVLLCMFGGRGGGQLMTDRPNERCDAMLVAEYNKLMMMLMTVWGTSKLQLHKYTQIESTQRRRLARWSIAQFHFPDFQIILTQRHSLCGLDADDSDDDGY